MSCSSSITNNSNSFNESFYSELTKTNIYDNMELLKMNDLREKNNKYNSNNKINKGYLVPEKIPSKPIMFNKDYLVLERTTSIPTKITSTPNIASTYKPESKNLKLDNNTNNISSYIDVLVNYFILNVNDLKSKNRSSLRNNQLLNRNENRLLNNKTKLNDKSFGILTLINDSERTNLNVLMKKIISYSNPKYQTFIITFILMDNFIETDEGLMYLEDINKVFLSCFFIACYHFENNGEYYEELLINTQIQKNLVSIKDLTKVQNVLCKLSPKDYDVYKSSFKSLYLQYSNNFNSLLIK